MAEEKQKTVCLVEDEPSIQETYGLKLRESGYRVLAATDGAQGLEVISREKPDLALVDINMPVMNGLELLEKMAEDEELAKIPVIILTNYDTQDIADQASKYPTHFFLVKAFYTPQKVADVVDEVLCRK
jgi:CheY-like chemotaxis protein